MVPLSEVIVVTGDRELVLSRTVDVLDAPATECGRICCTFVVVDVVVVAVESCEFEPIEEVVFALVFVPGEGPEMELEVELVICEVILAKCK